MSRRYIEFYIIMGILTLTVLVLLVGKYYFGWFESTKGNYARYEPVVKTINEPLKPLVSEEIKENTNNDEKPTPEIVKLNQSIIINNNSSDSHKNNDARVEKKQIVNLKKESTSNNIIEKKEIIKLDREPAGNRASTNIITDEEINIVRQPVSIAKRVVFNDQNFHSLGEFVSNEEKDYRFELINNLTVNTVVIDKLSKGNGISHEFFKVAYQTRMIPAKILIDIVESKEFRDLIPKTMLLREKSIQLKDGEKVVFNAPAIKNLLVLWAEGKITPVQKVWIVGADK